MRCFVTIEGPTESSQVVSDTTNEQLNGEFIDEDPIGNELTGVVVGWQAGDVVITLSVETDAAVGTWETRLVAGGFEVVPQVG